MFNYNHPKFAQIRKVLYLCIIQNTNYMKTFEARYIRTSTKMQNQDRQENKKVEGEKIYSDVCSGSIPFMERVQGSKLIQDIKNGLVSKVSFHACDRCGRNTLDVISTLTLISSYGVNIRIENLGLESIINGKVNPMFNMITMLLAEVSTMEKNNLLERQREAIDLILLNEKHLPIEKRTYKGRIKGSVDTPSMVLEKHRPIIKVLEKYPTMSLREVARQCSNDTYKVSANTVRKVKALI